MHKYARSVAIIALLLSLTWSTYSIPTYTLGISRHSRVISDVAKKDLYTFEVLFRWLNNTNLLQHYDIKPYDYIALKNTALYMLKDIYTNPSLSAFTGGLQLRTLKRFAYSSSNITGIDIVNIVIATASGFNISIDNTRCGNPLSNLLTNILHRDRYCRYHYSDLDVFTEYVTELGGNISHGYLVSIISKLYTIKVALQGRGIYRDALEGIMDKLLYEESIVTYLFLEDFLAEMNINIIERPTYTPWNRILPEYADEKLSKPLTLEDIEDILNKTMIIISSLRERGMDIPPVDIPRIISYAMNVELDKVLNVLKSIELNEGFGTTFMELPPTSSISVYSGSRHSVNTSGYSQTLSTFSETYGEGDYTVLPEAYLYDIITSPMHVNASMHTINRLEDVEEKLRKYIEKVNTIDIDVPNVMSPAPYQNQSEHENIIKVREEPGDFSPYNISLPLYIALSAIPAIGTLLILGGRHLLKYILKLLNTNRVSTDSAGKIMYNQLHFELFWNLVYRLGHIFGIQISDSETHREIYSKLVHKLDELGKEYKELLKDVVRGYEVLRFSRNTFDREIWMKSIIKITKFIEDKGRPHA